MDLFNVRLARRGFGLSLQQLVLLRVLLSWLLCQVTRMSVNHCRCGRLELFADMLWLADPAIEGAV